MNVISRDTARLYGLRRFFTGKPCIHGHIAQRYTGNNACIECESLRGKKRRVALSGDGLVLWTGHKTVNLLSPYTSPFYRSRGSSNINLEEHMIGTDKSVQKSDTYANGRIDAFNEVLECIKWGNDIVDVRRFVEGKLNKLNGLKELTIDFSDAVNISFDLTSNSILMYPDVIPDGVTVGVIMFQQDAVGGREVTLDERFTVVGPDFKVEKAEMKFTILQYTVGEDGKMRLYPYND